MTGFVGSTLDSIDDGYDFVSAAKRVADAAGGSVASEVDKNARFPHEAVSALKAERLLSALVPREFGGSGASVTEVAQVVTAVGRSCSSAGMVLAMHQIQVACLVAHGHNDVLRALLAAIADDQLLLASATTEKGVGGDIRTSMCAVEIDEQSFRLSKEAMVISYGQYADVVMATARRTIDSPPGDQVMVACQRPGLTLEPIGDWDVLGFRGTCSLGFRLQATGNLDNVLPVPFGDICASTMLPVSHVLWSSLWVGMAAAAVDKASQFVRTQGRARPGVLPPSATRLAELVSSYQRMLDIVQGGVRRLEESAADPRVATSMRFAVAINSLKVSASSALVEIVGQALLICGMAGYRDGGPFSLGRLLRDAHGAQIMVNNDRIIANNAQLLMVSREI